MSQTYQQAVSKTVMWWSHRSFNTILNQYNGDNSNHGMMAFLLKNIVVAKAQSSVTPDKINKFKEKLTELLMAAEHSFMNYRLLDVDYQPCEKLSIACEYAGINPSCLPCKTLSVIERDNKVMTRYRYGSPWIEI